MNPLAESLLKVARVQDRRPAIFYNGRTTSYRGFFQAAERVAVEIKTSRKEAGTVAIVATQPLRMLRAVVGAVLADVPFICLQPNLPEMSRAALLHDAGVSLLVDDEKVFAVVRTGAPLPREVCGVFGTSGSTGRPLGVMHTHASILHNAQVYGRTAGLGQEDRLTLLSSPMFAAAHSAIWGAWLHGAGLAPFDVRRHGLAAFHLWLGEVGATVVHLVPTFFRSWMRTLPETALSSVRLLRLGGEPVLESDVRLFKAQFPSACQMMISLGLSENGGTLAMGFVDKSCKIDFILPVGRVSEGYAVKFQNEDGDPAKTGEIVVESPYLALGYAGQPERTKERFRQGRLHTGDWGSWTSDGQLLHHGRRDRQVKIRGHRVELNRVENALLSHAQIAKAVVLVEGKAEFLRLSAWVVLQSAGTFSSHALRRDLSQELAPWEMPWRITFCQKLPLTENGKIDRRSLPIAEGVAPRTPLESRLTALWQEVLDLPTAHVYSHFFEEGGHSLAAMELIAALDREGFCCGVGDLLPHPTPAEMAVHLESGLAEKTTRTPHLLPLRETGDGPILLLVPGGLTREAEMFVYAGLLPFLPTDCPVWGVRAHFESCEESLSGMTDRILEELTVILKERSCDILTDCLGTTLGWEIACRLVKENRQPRQLIAMDPQRLEVNNAREKIRLKQQNLLSDPQEKPLAFYEYALFLSRHPLQPYPGPVQFVWSNARFQDVAQRDFWKGLVETQFHEHQVEGDHASYIRQHRAALGALLAECLETSDRLLASG